MKHIIQNNGKELWKNDNNHYHREDGGPSFINTAGGEYWDIDGKLHKINGPARIHADGDEAWFVNGKRIK